MKLNEMILKYCRDHDISQQHFAELSGISKGYMSMIINERNPKTGKPPVLSIQAYDGIAKTMGLNLIVLLGTIDDAPDYLFDPICQLHETVKTNNELYAVNSELSSEDRRVLTLYHNTIPEIQPLVIHLMESNQIEVKEKHA